MSPVGDVLGSVCMEDTEEDDDGKGVLPGKEGEKEGDPTIISIPFSFPFGRGGDV
jgi:hypothetical protein